jgi:hypothetical protein
MGWGLDRAGGGTCIMRIGLTRYEENLKCLRYLCVFMSCTRASPGCSP